MSEHDVAPVRRRYADLHRAGKNAHQPAARIALREYGFSSCQGALAHIGAKVLDHSRWQLTK